MVIRVKGYYIMMKGPTHQEHKTIINIYAPNIRTPNINIFEGINRQQYNNSREHQ